MPECLDHHLRLGGAREENLASHDEPRHAVDLLRLELLFNSHHILQPYDCRQKFLGGSITAVLNQWAHPYERARTMPALNSRFVGRVPKSLHVRGLRALGKDVYLHLLPRRNMS